MLDLTLTKRKELVEEMKVKGTSVASGHIVLEFLRMRAGKLRIGRYILWISGKLVLSGLIGPLSLIPKGREEKSPKGCAFLEHGAERIIANSSHEKESWESW